MSNTSLLGSFGGQGDSSLMFRNVLINGCFRVWQRGTAQANMDANSYLADRWRVPATGSTRTASRQAFALGQTDVPGNPEFFHRTVVSSVTGAGNFVTLNQRIEGVESLAGQAVSISFWAKADAPKQIALSFIQRFGAGGSPSADVNTYIAKVSLTASWQLFTVTAIVPSISGKTLGTDGNDFLQLTFWFDAGTGFNADTGSLGQQSGTFDIAQVQLEAGPTATPFERRPIGTEIQLCQRYFEKSYNIDVAPGTNTAVGRYVMSGSTDINSNAYVHIRFAVPKRTSGSGIILTAYTTAGTLGSFTYNRSGANGSSSVNWNASEAGNSYAWGYFSAGAAFVPAIVDGHWTANAEL